MPPAGVSLEHDDRALSRPDGRSPDGDAMRRRPTRQDAGDGLHRRPTRTVAVDLDRLTADDGPVREGNVLTLDTSELGEAPPTRRSDRPDSTDPGSVQRSPGVDRVSPQPSPNPIAAGVAERYAKALTLNATTPAPPQPRTPRRSRAAMRDRALDPPARSRSRGGAPAPALADSAPATRSRGAAAPGIADRAAAPRARAAAAPAAMAPRRPAASALAATAPRRPAASPTSGATELRPPVASAGTEAPATGRRTVTIRGRGAERDYSWTYDSSRRPSRPVHERPGFKPDRAALWAVFLGLLLVLVAATSAHAAVLAHAVH